MSGHDILIETNPDRDVVRSVIASLYGVQRDVVDVVGDLAEASPASAVLVQIVPLRGQFHTMVSVDSGEDIPAVDALTLARAFVRTFHTRALISDDSVDPYTRILVDADSVRPVTLDTDALDDRDEYTLQPT